jgi:two-component system OmpR family response regulator
MAALLQRLLVADDDVAIGTLIARIVTPMGLTPVLAANGAQAIAIAQHYRLELAAAILDVQMPGTTGIEAAEAIQQLLPNLPIILMSAALPPQAQIAHLRLAGTLTKPFAMSTLQTLLRQLGLGKHVP